MQGYMGNIFVHFGVKQWCITSLKVLLCLFNCPSGNCNNIYMHEEITNNYYLCAR